MNIVFWSCMPGHAAVSSSMLAVACTCAADQKFNTAVLQTQYKKNNLQYPFFKLEDKSNVEQYNHVGMDSLIRTVKGGDVSGGVETCAFSFLGSKLSVYPQSSNLDGKAYYNGLIDAMPLMFKSLDSAFDLAFIDTAGGNDPASWQALKNADKIVICVPQETWIVNYLFSKYTFDPSKVFYLFGDYDPKKVITVGSVTKSKQMRGKFGTKNSAYIAHDVDFANALDTSDITRFFVRGLGCDKSNPNYEFFNSVQNATKKILTFAGVSLRK